MSSSCELVAPQGGGRPTPSRFLSSYFSNQCAIYGGGECSQDGITDGTPFSQSAFSQEGVLGTLDFITPQEHQFTVGHNNEGDPNKENKPMRSPAPISPGGRKKAKTFMYNSDSDMECSQEQRAGSNPSTSSQPDLPPGAPSRSSILHYMAGTPPGTSKPPAAARKRGLMAPPPIRSPQAIPNPFLGGPAANKSGEEKRKTKGQLPSSRYRADFKELGVLGKGAFSKVYRVKSRIDGAEYAMKRSAKELHTEMEKSDALQEVQALAAAGSHPNLIRYFTAWWEPADSGQHLFIQLEVCAQSLTSLMESGHKFSESELMDIMKQLAAGLRHLHSRGMAHLDVKPDNVYVSLDGSRYVVGDFGLVTRMDGTTKVNEGDGRYLPLEMMNENHSKLDKVDMFSLGATMLELSSGQPLPKEGPLYQAIRRGKPPLPQRFSQVCPLIRSIKALLSESPDDRPTADSICRGAVGRSGLGLLLQPSSLSRPKH